MGDTAKRASGKDLRDSGTESDPIQANQEREDTGGHESEAVSSWSCWFWRRDDRSAETDTISSS